MLTLHPRSTHAACILADAAEAAANADEGGDADAAASAARAAHDLFAQCAAADPIRAPYWTFRMRAGELAQTS